MIIRLYNNIIGICRFIYFDFTFGISGNSIFRLEMKMILDTLSLELSSSRTCLPVAPVPPRIRATSPEFGHFCVDLSHTFKLFSELTP